MVDVDLLVAIVVGYLLGSIPVADLVTRRRGVQLRSVGDCNPGYWNARETMGRRAAVPVLLGDGAKGLIAGLVGMLLAGLDAWSVDGFRVWDASNTDWWLGWVALGAAMAGHAYPVFARFRGGRSVMTFAGGVIAVTPLAAAVAIVATLIVTRLKSFAWGARVGVFGLPIAQFLVDPAVRVAATGACMTIIGARFLQAALVRR
jgi:acyl phosphate:glycerol-3-phosphate acyltransferase